MSNEKKQMIFIPPPFITQTYTYQNINKDPNIREKFTIFYYNKIIKWIRQYKEFAKYKNLLPFLKTKKGYFALYNLLREFVKKHNVNWYDLKDKYSVVKDYLRYKLAFIAHK